MKNEALGLIETRGYLGVVEALDVCLKSADVEFAGCEVIGGGLVTIKVVGDVSAVKAAVDAGSAAAKRVAKLISVLVIPRPFDETVKIFCDDRKSKINPTYKENEQKIKTQYKLKDEIQNKVKDKLNNDKNETLFDMKKKLEKMKVVELRNLARKINLSSIERKQIKFSKKKQLINAILDFYKGRQE